MSMKHKNNPNDPLRDARDEAEDMSAVRPSGPVDETPGGMELPDSQADAVAVEPDRVGQLEADLADQRDKYLRLAAEYENFRKRTVRERQEAELRGMGLLIRGLLDALDDLGRFANVDPSTVDAATVVQGADMVEKKLLKALAGHGLEVVNPAGQPFAPALHEAVATTRAALPEEDHRVAQVYQVGYVFNGQLLRPARVVVTQWHDEP